MSIHDYISNLYKKDFLAHSYIDEKDNIFIGGGIKENNKGLTLGLINYNILRMSFWNNNLDYILEPEINELYNLFFMLKGSVKYIYVNGLQKINSKSEQTTIIESWLTKADQ